MQIQRLLYPACWRSARMGTRHDLSPDSIRSCKMWQTHIQLHQLPLIRSPINWIEINQYIYIYRPSNLSPKRKRRLHTLTASPAELTIDNGSQEHRSRTVELANGAASGQYVSSMTRFGSKFSLITTKENQKRPDVDIKNS